MIAALAAKGVRAKFAPVDSPWMRSHPRAISPRFLSACANARVPSKQPPAFTTYSFDPQIHLRAGQPFRTHARIHQWSFSPALCFSSAPIKTMRLRRSRSSRPPRSTSTKQKCDGTPTV